ncbi:MAG: cobalamin-dependent protein, partial [Desulfobacteraceae bacterium]
MKVLLISANKYQIPYPVYPLGLDYVCEALRPKHQVKVIDLNSLNGIRGLKTMIGEFEPDIIGVSLRNIDNTDTIDALGFFSDYRELIQDIRETTRARIVLGGAGFSIFPKEAMQALGADYGIIGEGERMPVLLDAIEQGEPVDHLPGVISNNGIQNFPQPWSMASSST